ncbi:MAG: hypothetical protein RL095_2167 [Verrucomicrobiota bacterium]|jgi:uncharacterized protein YjcR
MATYTEEQKSEARKLFLQGCKVVEIEELLSINRRTLYTWIKEEMWGEALNEQSSLYVAHHRLQLLLNREHKQPGDLQEIEALVGVIDRLAKIEARTKAAAAVPAEVASAADPAKGERGERKKKSKSQKNDFSGVSEAVVMDHFFTGLFDYQKELWEVRRERVRQVLKSRQIGLTFYFAREAFADALCTGRNKAFLSASRAQSDIFREYIKGYALDWFGVELTGKDKIEIITPHGTATLYFLSTNATTSQGYHGDVYIDEYFWIPGFAKLNKLAGAMAAHKQWTKTYFSTPSAKSHAAFPFWSGDLHNERNKKANKARIPMLSEAELHSGARWTAGDGCWRRIINLDDAEKQGCNLFDREQLKLEYSPEEYRQLFLCEFIDDSGSVFRFAELEKCLSDETEWKPEGGGWKGPVWIGYDPSRIIDGAAIVVLAPPAKTRGRFLVLEKITLYGERWESQAAVIEALTQKYQVEYIGIDITGPGSGVFELVQKFFPRATPINYGVQVKTNLVLKAQSIIGEGRILWDSRHSDIAAAFMMIKRAAGGSTFFAERSATTGHADVAWAIMHALINEGLTLPRGDGGNGVRVSFGEAA